MKPVQDRPKLALVGPTGLVGRGVLDVLSTRADAWDAVKLLDHDRAVGRRELVGSEEIEIDPLDSESFYGVDVAIFATPSVVSAKWAQYATAAGCHVVDCSDAFRTDVDVPVVVPEINPGEALDHPRGIVAQPSGPSLITLPVLETLHQLWTITDVTMTTLQAVTGAGRAGAERLYSEVLALSGRPRIGQMPGDVRRYIADLPEDSPFPAPIVSNVVPWVGESAGDGWSTEEIGIRDELRKVLGIPGLPVAATCVQVPIVTTHMATVHVRFDRKVKLAEARKAVIEAPNGSILMNDAHGEDWPTPADAVGTDPIWVGRMRQAEGKPYTLDFMVCGDNIRKGAALNALQIAEILIDVGPFAEAARAARESAEGSAES